MSYRIWGGKKIPWTDEHMLLDLYANHQQHEINAKETLWECFCLIKKTELTNFGMMF